MNEAHPPDATLKDYSNGRLDRALATAVGEHLLACPRCRARAERARAEGLPAAGEPDSATKSAPPPRGPGAPRGSATPALELPDYEILKRLGGGGMGVVYLARNTLMGRFEVLKVVAPHLTDRPEVLERFLQEIQSAARLHHRNIVSAYAAIRSAAGLILAMEYVDGVDLDAHVQARGPLPVVEACFYACQAALGLQHAHERGMVHRDIKPANLIVDRSRAKGVVKVLDFGLAKVASERPPDAGLTRHGLMLGTPDYIAPEQIRDTQAADIRSDIYSLGCTLYFLLAGRPPFDGASLYDVLRSHHHDEATPLDRVRPDLPAGLAALVARMMAKAPGDRPPTPSAVVEALRPFMKPAGATGRGGTSDSSAATAPPRDELPGLRAILDAPRPDPSPVGVAMKPPDQADESSLELDGLVVLEASGGVRLTRSSTPSSGVGRPALVFAGIAVALAAVVALYKAAPRPASQSPPPPVASRPEAPDRGPLRRPETPGRDPGEPAEPGPTGLADAAPGGPAEAAMAPIAQASPPAPVEVASPGQAKAKRSGSAKPARPGFAERLGIKIIPLPPGTFLMGSPDSDRAAAEDEKPQHRVSIPAGRGLSAREITVGQFAIFVEATGYRTDAERDEAGGQWTDGITFGWSPDCNWRNARFDQTDEHPVLNVSWDDATRFCAWLSRQDGRRYRLPTEAEWEYACRAGTSTVYSFGDDPRLLAGFGNSVFDDCKITSRVGSFRSNPWGFEDMHGNLWEWCFEYYDVDYYKHSPVDDPFGPRPGPQRSIRGGCWWGDYRSCRSGNRNPTDAGFKGPTIGFRVARVSEP